MFAAWLRARFGWAADALGHRVADWGVTANQVSAVSVALVTLVASPLVALGFVVPGVALGFAALSLDVLDGAVARAHGVQVRHGRFVDDVADRVSDGALWSGVVILCVLDHPTTYAVAAVLCAALSQLQSYVAVAARAELPTVPLGRFTRLERLGLVAIGLVVSDFGPEYLLIATLIVVAAMSFSGCAQRVAAVLKSH